MSTAEFIEKAIKIHGNKYDYSKVNYVNPKTNVCIICPIHSEFNIKPINHIQGIGCPKCNESKLEEEIRYLLDENKIKYVEQKTFSWLKSKQNYLRLDFYLEDYNIAIECQGEQHFKPIRYFGGESSFNNTVKWDNLKNKLCNDNNIYILYYSNIIENNYNLGKIINDKSELLNNIKKYGRK